MESEQPKRLRHKEWRRLVKKLRRKRLRREFARNRQLEIEELQLKLESTEEYRQWVDEKNRLEEIQAQREELEHAVAERAWLEAEVKAQQEWQVIQERKAKARQLLVEQQELIRESFEEMSSRRRRDDSRDREDRRDRRDSPRERRRSDRDTCRKDGEEKMSEKLKKEFDDYIDNGAATPEPLRVYNETQPRREVCPFFAKTGACRYGDVCSRNHMKPQLSAKICVPGFYTHFSLEKHRGEYDTDNRLEYETRETRNHFRDFYTDVVPELEKFGKIRTLQYCKNTEPHLRGNLYIEYETEREAARALRGLRGRWYAGRQLNCYFVNFKSWRGAVCGMVRCPKGSACNFLHVFKNPKEDYDIKSPPLWAQRQDAYERPDERPDRRNRNKNNWDDSERRSWRWSESPPPRGGGDRRRGGDRFRDKFSPPHNRGRGRFDNRRGFRGGRRGFGEGRFRSDRQFNNGNRRRRFSDSGSDGMGRRSRTRSRSPRRFSPSGSDGARSMSRSRSLSRGGSQSKSRSRTRTRSRSYSRPTRITIKNDKMIPLKRNSPSRSPSPRDRGVSPGMRGNQRNYPSPRRDRSMSASPQRKPDDYQVLSKLSDGESSDHSKKKPRAPPPSNWADKYKSREPETNDNFHHQRQESPPPPRHQQISSPRRRQESPPRRRQESPPRRRPGSPPPPRGHHQPPSGDPRKGGPDYEWDTTDSDN